MYYLLKEKLLTKTYYLRSMNLVFGLWSQQSFNCSSRETGLGSFSKKNPLKKALKSSKEKPLNGSILFNSIFEHYKRFILNIIAVKGRLLIPLSFLFFLNYFMRCFFQCFFWHFGVLFGGFKVLNHYCYNIICMVQSIIYSTFSTYFTYKICTANFGSQPKLECFKNMKQVISKKAKNKNNIFNLNVIKN